MVSEARRVAEDGDIYKGGDVFHLHVEGYVSRGARLHGGGCHSCYGGGGRRGDGRPRRPGSWETEVYWDVIDWAPLGVGDADGHREGLVTLDLGGCRELHTIVRWRGWAEDRRRATRHSHQEAGAQHSDEESGTRHGWHPAQEWR